MEEFIKRIIEINKEAEKMTSNIGEMRKTADREIAAELQNMNSKAKQEADAEVEKYRNDFSEEMRKKFESKNAEYDSFLEAFDSIYAQHRDEWIDTLVKRAVE